LTGVGARNHRADGTGTFFVHALRADGNISPMDFHFGKELGQLGALGIV
jgi:hypothetical protein